MNRIIGVLVVLCVALSPTLARADEAEGRRHWKAGQELYAQKRFREAAHEFEAGYAVAPRPLFLMNIGHAYRRASELVKAKSAYQALLRLQPDLPQRAEVEAYIKSIDDALSVGETVVVDQPGPPAQTATPGRGSPSLAARAPRPQVPAYVEARDASASRKPEAEVSTFQKPWFWVVTGALVAGGVAVAIIASRPSTSCPGTVCVSE